MSLVCWVILDAINVSPKTFWVDWSVFQKNIFLGHRICWEILRDLVNNEVSAIFSPFEHSCLVRILGRWSRLISKSEKYWREIVVLSQNRRNLARSHDISRCTLPGCPPLELIGLKPKSLFFHFFNKKFSLKAITKLRNLHEHFCSFCMYTCTYRSKTCFGETLIPPWKSY